MKNYLYFHPVNAKYETWNIKKKTLCLSSILYTYKNPKKVLHSSCNAQNSIRIKWRKYKSFLLILTMPSWLLNCWIIFLTKPLKICVCVSVSCEHHQSASATVNGKVSRTLFVSDSCATKSLPNWVHDLHFMFDFFSAQNFKLTNDNKIGSVHNRNINNEHKTNNSPKKRRSNLLCQTAKWNRCFKVFWSVSSIFCYQ